MVFLAQVISRRSESKSNACLQSMAQSTDSKISVFIAALSCPRELRAELLQPAYTEIKIDLDNAKLRKSERHILFQCSQGNTSAALYKMRTDHDALQHEDQLLGLNELTSSICELRGPSQLQRYVQPSPKNMQAIDPRYSTRQAGSTRAWGRHTRQSQGGTVDFFVQVARLNGVLLASGPSYGRADGERWPDREVIFDEETGRNSNRTRY